MIRKSLIAMNIDFMAILTGSNIKLQTYENQYS